MKMKVSGTHSGLWEAVGYSQAGKRPEEGLGPRAHPWGGTAGKKGSAEQEGRGGRAKGGSVGKVQEQGPAASDVCCVTWNTLICFSDYSFQRECSQAGVLPSVCGYGFLCEEEIERIGAQLIRSQPPAFESKILETVSCNRRRGFLSCVIHKSSLSYTVIWVSHGWSWALLVLKIFSKYKEIIG